MRHLPGHALALDIDLLALLNSTNLIVNPDQSATTKRERHERQ